MTARLFDDGLIRRWRAATAQQPRYCRCDDRGAEQGDPKPGMLEAQGEGEWALHIDTNAPQVQAGLYLVPKVIE